MSMLGGNMLPNHVFDRCPDIVKTELVLRNRSLSPASFDVNSFLLGSMDIPSLTLPCSDPVFDFLSTTPPSPVSSTSTSEKSIILANTKERLLHYFSIAVDPPAVEAVNGGWSEVRKAVLAMSKHSVAVANAVYALAELHSARTQNKELALSRSFYDTATEELHWALQREDLDNDEWERLLTAVCLISCFEIIAHDGNGDFRPKERWADLLLRKTMHKDVRRFRFYQRRLMTWHVFLDAKVATLGNSSLLEYETARSIDETMTINAGDFILSQNENSVCDIVCNAVCYPAYCFHLENHKYSRRIQQQDRHSRKRETIEDELEIQTELQQIVKELKDLWERGPAILTLRAEDLANYVDPSIATDVYVNLRVYLAHFWTHFIYLHRVGWGTFPATGDAKLASKRIWDLINEPIVSDSPGMLWPLFMFSLEATLVQQQFAIARMRQPDNKIAHANRAADLLQEVLRRQNDCHQRVQVKQVAVEKMYGNVFPII